MIKHFINKLFATKVETPCRDSIQEVSLDTEFLCEQYDKIGMKLIDMEYREYIQKTHSKDEFGNVWLNKTHMSYAVLYFAKGVSA